MQHNYIGVRDDDADRDVCQVGEYKSQHRSPMRFYLNGGRSGCVGHLSSISN